MSQLSQILREKAEEIRLSSPTEVAVEHLKQAGYSETDARAQVEQHIMEKEAANVLMQNGVDAEQAVAMVKAAGINIRELTNYAPAKSEDHPSVELLKQAANYIDALEAEVAHVKEEKEEIEKAAQFEEVEMPASIAKAASVGAFTNEDLAELQKIDPTVLNKIASAMDEPWSLGSGTGYARPKTDPFLEFLVQ
jgi:hypothetical protein